MYRNPFLAFVCLIVLTGYSALFATENYREPTRVITTKLDSGTPATLLSRNTDYGCQIDFKITELSTQTVTSKGGIFDQLSILGYANSNRIGAPQLPLLRKLIYVPLGAEIKAEARNPRYKEYTGKELGISNPVYPAQLSVSKSADPDKIEFRKDTAAYTADRYNDHPLVSVTEIGLMRGVRLVAIDFEPVKYNPVQNKFMVYTDVSVQVDYLGGDLSATRDMLDKTASYEFDRLYAREIFNWRDNERSSIVRYPTGYVILAPATFNATLASFITWKKQQGYVVTLKNVGTGAGEVANTTTAIKAYMQTLWNNATPASPAPTYALFVGDVAQVVANTGMEYDGPHPTDLNYVRLNGTDFVPEMYYGRFSVTTTTELQNIIDKTLMFEKTTMPSTAYLGEAVMIAGDDTTYGPTHGDGQINYGTANYFNAAHGITSYTYLYPSTSYATVIKQKISGGVGYANYTAHGSESGWAAPSFQVSEVANLTNVNEYPVIVGNCCLTNKFDVATCFGEALIRAQNKGAVIYIGGTNSTYWDEDYWWGVGAKGTANGTAPAYDATKLGVYDGLFHGHSEAVTDWCQTTGDMIYNGNLAVTQGASDKISYYWEIYSIMGDPSLYPYMGVPTVHTATYPSSIFIGSTSVTVNADPQSRVAITMGGVLYGTGIVGTSGVLNLTITPFTAAGTADIVITRQNKKTLISTISVVPNSGAYLTLDSWTYADGNNGVAEYNETGRINATFKNIGSSAATNVVCTLSSTNAGINFTDNTETLASLAAGASITLNSAYAYNTAANMADQTSVPFSMAMVSGTSSWSGSFGMTINAPVIALGSAVITDPTGNNNGRLDPGETVSVTIPLQNTGHAASVAGSGTLSCATSGINVNTDNASFASIATNGSTNLVFSLTAAGSVAVGTVASLVFNATSGGYTATKTETTILGLVQETFETGNFSLYPWSLGGNLPWTIVSTGAHAGIYTAKSGAITHSQTSSMETTRNVTTAGNVTFWYKVSSEASYDYLKFYVDGALQTNSWAGEVGWAQATYALTTGTHILKWIYSKDSTTNSGSDCAWVDDIVFPASTSVFNPPMSLSVVASHAKVALSWAVPASGTPSSYNVFRGGTLLATVTSLTYNDTAVTNGTAYTYYVTATYSSPAGESAATSTVNATPIALPASGLVATAGNSSVALSWMAPIAGTPSGYKIYRNSSFLATANTLTYSDNTAVNGAAYTYYVTATYTSPTAESAASNTATATPILVTSVTIGTGTYTQRQPFGMYFGYERSAALYTSANIGTTGTINMLSWSVATSQTTSAPVTIRLKTTTSTTLTASSWATMISGATTVYTGSALSFATTGWKQITLTTPFDYTSGSLLVLIETNYSGTGTSSYPYFHYTSATGLHQLWYADSTAPTGNGSVDSYRPNIQIGFRQSTAAPTISVNQTSMAFGNVYTSMTSAQNFTISNTGTGTLSGQITTPTGYTVSLSAKSNERGQSSQAYTRAVLSFSVNAGSSAVYSMTFTPTSATTFNGNVVITSNDTAHPTVNIAVTGTGVTPTFNPPRNLITTAGNVQIKLDWLAPASGTPTGYKIYKNSTLLTTVTALTYTDTAIVNGTLYPYYVIAVYTLPTGESVASNTVNARSHVPVINLPAQFSFSKNTSLTDDFAAYATDANNDALSLSVSGNLHIQPQISGLSVTFTAEANWFGTETLTFTASDGTFTASDNVTVNVQPVNNPAWTPVVYPNNSATVYGIVTLVGLAASVDDIVGAFVGNECRATGTIVLQNSQAYVTMLVNLALNTETVTFKVYDSSADVVFTDLQTATLGFGQAIGSVTPYPISATSANSLDSPVVTITPSATGILLNWSPVTGADEYQVWYSTHSGTGFNMVRTTTSLAWDITNAGSIGFYQVIAIRNNLGRQVNGE